MEKPDLNKPVFKIFPEIKKAVEDAVCPACGTKITGFKDKLSEKEYSISGMCQECQDKIWKRDKMKKLVIEEEVITKYYERCKERLKNAKEEIKTGKCDKWYEGYAEGRVSGLEFVLSHIINETEVKKNE